MVLDVTRLLLFICTHLWRDALEFGHNNLHRLAHNVGESVETASMGHAKNEGARTFFDSGVDAELKARNKRFASLETEALHRVEFACHEGAPLMSPV